jgi:hypothetical protein
MQPVWESVKLNGSSSSKELDINFPLNYHRAWYHSGYDDPEDISLQRFRLEDVPWEISTGRWRETFALQPFEQFTLTNLLTNFSWNYSAAQRSSRMAELMPPAELRAMYADFSPFNHNRANRQPIQNALTPQTIFGQGFRPVTSNFQDPQLQAMSAWSPESVPAVKAQSWPANYRDKNIADNPSHPTVPDLLIGPKVIVQKRRTKYVALSRLTDDYLNTTGSDIVVLEGEAVNGDSLLAALAGSERGPAAGARFGWDAATAGAGRSSTDTPDVHARDAQPEGAGWLNDPGRPLGALLLDTQEDWQDRLWQFNSSWNDRALDFRNFRDRQGPSGDVCPAIHHASLIVFAQCQRILNALQLELTPPMLDAKHVQHSFFQALSTADYEACLANHTALLTNYSACVQARVPSFDALAPSAVNSRECVGGGGRCGQPANGAVPLPASAPGIYGFAPFNAAALGMNGSWEPDLTNFVQYGSGTDGSQRGSTVPNRAKAPSYYGSVMSGRPPVQYARRLLLEGEEEGEGGAEERELSEAGQGEALASASDVLPAEAAEAAARGSLRGSPAGGLGGGPQAVPGSHGELSEQEELLLRRWEEQGERLQGGAQEEAGGVQEP